MSKKSKKKKAMLLKRQVLELDCLCGAINRMNVSLCSIHQLIRELMCDMRERSEISNESQAIDYLTSKGYSVKKACGEDSADYVPMPADDEAVSDVHEVDVNADSEYASGQYVASPEFRQDNI